MSDSKTDEPRGRVKRLTSWRPTGKQVAVGAGLIGLVALAVITKGAIFEGAEPVDMLSSGWGGTRDNDDDDRKPPRRPEPHDDPSPFYLE